VSLSPAPGGKAALGGLTVMSQIGPAQLTASDVMTAAKVAELTRWPVSTVSDYARRRVIPSRKIGRHRLFLRSEIEAVLRGEWTPETPE
jgi:excisionase family DNA binding protein